MFSASIFNTSINRRPYIPFIETPTITRKVTEPPRGSKRIANQNTSAITFRKKTYEDMMNAGDVESAVSYCDSCKRTDIVQAMYDGTSNGDFTEAASVAGIRGFHGRSWANRYIYRPYTLASYRPRYNHFPISQIPYFQPLQSYSYDSGNYYPDTRIYSTTHSSCAGGSCGGSCSGGSCGRRRRRRRRTYRS